MSRVFRVEGEYEPELEAVVARAVDVCRRDRWFRKEDVSPKMRLVPDFMIREHIPDGEEVIVIVTTTSELKKTIEAMQRVVAPQPTTSASTDGGATPG